MSKLRKMFVIGLAVLTGAMTIQAITSITMMGGWEVVAKSHN